MPVTATAASSSPRKGRPEIISNTGNAQTTRNGDLFAGWGALPCISEFSPSGQLLVNAELPAGLTSYRAYRLPWHPAGQAAGHARQPGTAPKPDMEKRVK